MLLLHHYFELFFNVPRQAILDAISTVRKICGGSHSHMAPKSLNFDVTFTKVDLTRVRRPNKLTV